MLMLMDKEVDGRENSRRKAGRWDSLITIINDRFQPYNIRGWFWASSLQSMGETNVFNGRKVSFYFIFIIFFTFLSEKILLSISMSMLLFPVQRLVFNGSPEQTTTWWHLEGWRVGNQIRFRSIGEICDWETDWLRTMLMWNSGRWKVVSGSGSKPALLSLTTSSTTGEALNWVSFNWIEFELYCQVELARHQVQRQKAHRLRGFSLSGSCAKGLATCLEMCQQPLMYTSENSSKEIIFHSRTFLWATSTLCVSRIPGSTSPRLSSTWSRWPRWPPSWSQSSTSCSQAIVFYRH